MLQLNQPPDENIKTKIHERQSLSTKVEDRDTQNESLKNNGFEGKLEVSAFKSRINIGEVWRKIRTVTDEFRVNARRPDDHLVFDLIFENMKVSGNPPMLVRKNENVSAYLIVEFPPQSFAERAFNVKPLETVPPLPSAEVRMAGRSRISFLMPDSEKSLEFTLEAVLNALPKWKVVLDVNAVQEPDPYIQWEFGQKFKFDRQWLTSTVTSDSWTKVYRDFANTLEVKGGRGTKGAFATSAKRIARRATGMLASGEKEDLSQVLQNIMQIEIERIVRRFPELDNVVDREASLVALSLDTSKMLAASKTTYEFDMDVSSRMPFIAALLEPHEPSDNVTAIEIPYRVVLSPISPARWVHENLPVEHNSRVELWHTRLTTADTRFGPDLHSKVRAIWSPDYLIGKENLNEVSDKDLPLPFRMSLSALDRHKLVLNMAGFNEKVDSKGKIAYHPKTSRAYRLHLSALGALLDVEGNWDPRPFGSDIQQWKHIAAHGRDQYVRVVQAGFLCGLPHKAVKVTITERKFESLPGDSKKRVAVLRKRSFVVPLERIKSYDGTNHKFSGHNFPFQSIEILTRVTPDLVEPGSESTLVREKEGEKIYDGDVPSEDVFWPMISEDNPFMFKILGTDLNGNKISFSMPLLFISETANEIKSKAIRAAYNNYDVNGDDGPRMRTADIGGARLCYAKRLLEEDPGCDPQLPTETVQFIAGEVISESKFHANFYPEIGKARVGITPIQKLYQRPDAIEVEYDDAFKQAEFHAGQNPSQVFLKIVGDFPQNFGEGSNQLRSDAIGGLVTPSMNIQGLSRKLGPIADLDNVKAKNFYPSTFFSDAKILGGVYLKDILADANILDGDMPKMLSRPLNDSIETKFEWEKQIYDSDDDKLFIPKADTNKEDTMISMFTQIRSPLKNPDETDFTTSATLNNFKVNLYGFIIISFEQLSFISIKGQKPDVIVNLMPGEEAVKFTGPLEFVNELKDIIPSEGFSDPPNITVTPSGIGADYSLDVPTVAVGIFSMSGVTLGCGFNLPFDSKPASVKFNFSERQHPFSLTVSLLSGGGYFAIGISTQGVQEIEAAIEFGAAIEIDLGVASGGVEIKAGLYFHWVGAITGNGSVELAGYVRLHGELSVLGLISASLTFDLRLSYLKDTNSGTSIVWGEATLVVEVEVLFFSADVSVQCRREFGGSKNSDPKFIDIIPQQEIWDEYCDMFVQEVVP